MAKVAGSCCGCSHLEAGETRCRKEIVRQPDARLAQSRIMSPSTNEIKYSASAHAVRIVAFVENTYKSSSPVTDRIPMLSTKIAET